MLIHTVFDLAGWLTSALVGVIVGRLNLLGPAATSRTPFSDPGYFIALGLGAIFVDNPNVGGVCREATLLLASSRRAKRP